MPLSKLSTDPENKSLEEYISIQLKLLKKQKNLCIRSLCFQYGMLIASFLVFLFDPEQVFVKYLWLFISIFYGIGSLITTFSYNYSKQMFYNEFSKFIPWWQLQKYGGWK